MSLERIARPIMLRSTSSTLRVQSMRLFASTASESALTEQIKAVGEKIRDLKKGKADKDSLTPHIDELLKLKQKYQEVTGSPFDPPSPTAKVNKNFLSCHPLMF